MSLTEERLREAVENCDRDPVHIPGKIQAIGVLVAADRAFESITFVSENAGELFGIPAADLIGAPASTLLTDEELHQIRNVLGHGTIGAQREVLFAKSFGGAEHQVSLHRQGEMSILEIAPDPRPAAERAAILERARNFLTLPLRYDDMGSFFDLACEHLRALTGYDRVKFYRFLPDGSGEIAAEARDMQMPSFLGLRFPATDIPPIARALYAKTPIRVIADVAADDIHVLGESGAEPLDMSLAVLRGKDKVHRQYLENMGVGGTMTVPAVVDGQLWGLFACHHMAPRCPDPSVLSAAELIGKLISLRLQHAVETGREAAQRRCMQLANRVVTLGDGEGYSADYWEDTKAEFATLVPCDGVVLSMGSAFHRIGDVPDDPTCRVIMAMSDGRGGGVTLIDDLRTRLPGANWGDTAGALVVDIQGKPGARIAFLRNVASSSVSWAGRPEKEVAVEDGVVRLSPRNSFELYLENAADRSIEWSADDEMIATALRSAFVQALMIQDQLREGRERMALMVRELNHRVRNILALVHSISDHSRAEAKSVEAYAASMEQRILALAGAHNLLTDSGISGAKLADLIEQEFLPFAGDPSRILISGPDVHIRPDTAAIIALVLHELTSNAAKYGALSVVDGSVAVSWRHIREGLEITWAEAGGPPVATPDRQGFGSSIILEAIPFELKGEAKQVFDPGGVRAEFWLPAEVITGSDTGTSEIRAPEPAQQAHDPDVTTKGAALIVEDDFLIARQARQSLQKFGFAPILTANNVADAINAITDSSLDFCLLDVNLNGEMSGAVAHALEARSIPFAFSTGYGSDGLEMTQSHAVPVMKKPFTEAQLFPIISELTARD